MPAAPKRTPIRTDTGHGYSEFRLTVNPVAADAIDAVCSQILGSSAPRGYARAGCSRWDDYDRTLIIWVVEPGWLEDPAFCVVGHEIWHGVRGNFHD